MMPLFFLLLLLHFCKVFKTRCVDLPLKKKGRNFLVRQKYLHNRRTLHTRRVVVVVVVLLRLRLARDDADDDDDDDDDDDGDEPWRQREGGRGGSIGTPSDYVRDILILILIFSDDNKTIEEEDVHDDDDDASTKMEALDVDRLHHRHHHRRQHDDHRRWPGNVHRKLVIDVRREGDEATSRWFGEKMETQMR